MARDWTADQRGVPPEKTNDTGNAGRGVGGQADDGSSNHNRGAGVQRDDGRRPAPEEDDSGDARLLPDGTP